MEQIQVGDVVRLKSGGPAMTVARYGEKHSRGTAFVCAWFQPGSKHHLDGPLAEGQFLPAALKKVSP